MKFVKALTPALMIAATATPAFADEEEHAHVDALLAIDPSGNLISGGYAFDEGEVENVDTRVYEAEFEQVLIEGTPTNIWTTDEPGFNAVSSSVGGLPAGYTTLPGSTNVTFTAKAFAIGGSTANLWHWDGTGAVNFAPVASPTELEISKAPSVVFSSILDGSASDVAGFTIDQTTTEGFLHKHIDFTITNTDSSAPADGFYLWSLTISADTLESDPLYFVHGLGAHTEEKHEEAAAFIESTLVPEPTSALALLAGAGLLAARRRRH